MFKPKKCLICGATFQPKSGIAKVCDECRPEYKKRRMQEYYREHYIQKGSYKWEMPKGKDSPFYKTGIGIFIRIAFEHYPHKCNRCSSELNLCVHHKDRNRKHNEVENLEIVCKSCHQKEHAPDRQMSISGKERSREAARAYQLLHPKSRDAKGRFISGNNGKA